MPPLQPCSLSLCCKNTALRNRTSVAANFLFIILVHCCFLQFTCQAVLDLDFSDRKRLQKGPSNKEDVLEFLLPWIGEWFFDFTFFQFLFCQSNQPLLVKLSHIPSWEHFGHCNALHIAKTHCACYNAVHIEMLCTALHMAVHCIKGGGWLVQWEVGSCWRRLSSLCTAPELHQC